MTIYKYKLLIEDEQIINLPIKSQILCVQVQRGQPCLWVKLNPTEKLAPRVIYTHGTGHEVGEQAYNYIGTYQLNDGMLVFHVFDGGYPK